MVVLLVTPAESGSLGDHKPWNDWRYFTMELEKRSEEEEEGKVPVLMGKRGEIQIIRESGDTVTSRKTKKLKINDATHIKV